MEFPTENYNRGELHLMDKEGVSQLLIDTLHEQGFVYRTMIYPNV
ncbi:MAG: hypothetical protein UR28_C0039G0041 [Candidatus Peregrinibacteria bacterium GW2011_GWF2_33_10]|nr:MAG: hypothetical protein UR28_C0039G0041 [Candidatus Peregrinibacteria bacterium GW2011_GWF2_33_10]